MSAATPDARAVSMAPASQASTAWPKVWAYSKRRARYFSNGSS